MLDDMLNIFFTNDEDDKDNLIECYPELDEMFEELRQVEEESN